MGGAVSAGRDNGELVDNLRGSNYIRTHRVEAVFRAVDRADYMLPGARNEAYKDLAWKDGQLHLSAPCIYSEVMEGLELSEGQTFLNVGSGTGYLSSMAGLILGTRGVNHGIEIHQSVVDYANKRLTEFVARSEAMDLFDFCTPNFMQGNGLCLAPLHMKYDRVYCGASCPDEYQNYFKQLIKVGGIVVMPLGDHLLQVRRVSEGEWTTKSLLNVSFAQLLVPSKEESGRLINMLGMSPPLLQVLSRSVIRETLREGVFVAYPGLKELPVRPVAPKKPYTRRICIPLDDDSDAPDQPGGLHDLDVQSGAREMNALLSLVLSMGQNRVAGALRFDQFVSESEGESEGHSTTSSSSSNGSMFSVIQGQNNAASGDNQNTNSSKQDTSQQQSPQQDTKAEDDTNAEKSLDKSIDSVTETKMPNEVITDVPMPDTEETIRLAPPSEVSMVLSASVVDTDMENKFPENAQITDEANGSNHTTITNTDVKEPSQSDKEVEVENPPIKKSEGSMDVITEETTTSDNVAGDKASSEKCESAEELESEEEIADCATWHRMMNQAKRREKFDSGIGEENSPEVIHSPEKNSLKTDESGKSDTSDIEYNTKNSRRAVKGLKRNRRALHERDSSSSDSSDSSDELNDLPNLRRAAAPSRQKQKKLSGPDPWDCRAMQISANLQAAVCRLPLPTPLKTYINLGRPVASVD